MKEIIIKVPDDFTEDQIEFIKKSAFNQIEAEMKKVLEIPQEDIDLVNEDVAEIKTAMGLDEPKEEEIKP